MTTHENPEGSTTPSTMSYVTSFDVAAPIDEVFRVATRPVLWWGEMIHGTSTALGDRFEWNVPGQHFNAFEVTEYAPGSRCAWTVLASGKEHEAEEWVGTVVQFTVTSAGDGTAVTFEHRGLTPSLECYDMCSRAWNYHLDVGLRAYLDGETARPLTYGTIDDVVATIGSSGQIE